MYCEICKSDIENDAKTAVCTNCGSVFHFNHLQNWLKKKHQCPNCRHEFNQRFISYFLANPDFHQNIPFENQTVEYIEKQQQQNINNFDGMVDKQDLKDRVENYKCIVCDKPASTVSRFADYTYCSFDHLIQTHPVIIIIIGLPMVFGLGLLSILQFSFEPLIKILIPILSGIFLVTYYFKIRSQGNHVRYIINLEKDQIFPGDIAVSTLGFMAFILYIYVRYYDWIFQ